MAAREETVRLLRAAFSKKEWEYLAQHGTFKAELDKGDGSTRSYEDLVSVGNLLLRQYKDARDPLGEFRNKEN
jgi:hypothetical protein